MQTKVLDIPLWMLIDGGAWLEWVMTGTAGLSLTLTVADDGGVAICLFFRSLKNLIKSAFGFQGM